MAARRMVGVIDKKSVAISNVERNVLSIIGSLSLPLWGIGGGIYRQVPVFRGFRDFDCSDFLWHTLGME